MEWSCTNAPLLVEGLFTLGTSAQRRVASQRRDWHLVNILCCNGNNCVGPLTRLLFTNPQHFRSPKKEEKRERGEKRTKVIPSVISQSRIGCMGHEFVCVSHCDSLMCGFTCWVFSKCLFTRNKRDQMLSFKKRPFSAKTTRHLISFAFCLGAHCLWNRGNLCLQGFDELVEKAMPQNIRLNRDLKLDEPLGNNAYQFCTRCGLDQGW